MNKWLSLTLSISLTALVFSFSAVSGEASGSLSLMIADAARKTIEWLIPSWQLQLETIHQIIRKGAHVFEYFLLGISWAVTLRKFSSKLIYLVILGLAIPLLDEGIQIFAVARGPSIIDALFFDVPGFFLGVGFEKCFRIIFFKTKASN